jgi:hypothetical protein
VRAVPRRVVAESALVVPVVVPAVGAVVPVVGVAPAAPVVFGVPSTVASGEPTVPALVPPVVAPAGVDPLIPVVPPVVPAALEPVALAAAALSFRLAPLLHAATPVTTVRAAIAVLARARIRNLR